MNAEFKIANKSLEREGERKSNEIVLGAQAYGFYLDGNYETVSH